MYRELMTVFGDRKRSGVLSANPQLWLALREGEGLTEILTDFYTRVYQDDRLAPFFHGATMARAIEKQYSFLAEIFTGKRIYFGERPRNAHHWMVISDELFDYREELMEQCLRRYGLSDVHVRSWRAVEEIFRKQIVKAAAVPKKIRGMTLPLEGYDPIEITAGSICDRCEAIIAAGTTVVFHVRTGKLCCNSCAPNPPTA